MADIVVPNATAPTRPDQAEKLQEYRLVEKLASEYDEAREFDREARKQYAVDRRYAAGTADMSWAVSTNLIGSYIDILKSYLYARNPDVSCRPAEHVPPDLATREDVVRKQIGETVKSGAAMTGLPIPEELIEQQIEVRTKAELARLDAEERKEKSEMDAFSKTMQIVVSRLWKRGAMKPAIRKAVCSTLSCGPGWLKVVMITDKARDPEVAAALNDAQDNLTRIKAARTRLVEGQVQDQETAEAELALQIQGLEAKVEVVVRKGLAIDFCSAEDVQVSLDVREITDYLQAGWVANRIFRRKDEIRGLFPTLSEDEARGAQAWYQRKPTEMSKQATPLAEVTYQDAEQYTTSDSGYTMSSGGQRVEFACVVELWDRRDNLIKTFIPGVKCWAKPPYPPPQASTRFYPYFLLALYETDGSRHPQSLSWRLYKLQDEYSGTRSSERQNRERSRQGVLFNSGQVNPENAKKLERGAQQEYIGIDLTNPEIPLQNVFAPKPVAPLDPLLYDTSRTVGDMEKVSGVQEALQSSAQVAKTATEAEIQQSGFAARASADRDCVEMMLDDMAQYTAEVALQALELPDAQRIAGRHAYWPHGMNIEDLLTMVEIDIAAGSTGKPNTNADREAWSTALPLIMSVMKEIQAALSMGNEPLARAMREVLRETLLRLGDRIDVDKFIPELPTNAMPPPPLAPPGAPGAPGAPPEGGEPAAAPAPATAAGLDPLSDVPENPVPPADIPVAA